MPIGGWVNGVNAKRERFYATVSEDRELVERVAGQPLLEFFTADRIGTVGG